MTTYYGHAASEPERVSTDIVYDLRCQFRIDDESALWDTASAKAMTYPDVTAETVIEMIGSREAPEITECLLLLLQPAIAGCELIELTCAAGTTGSATQASSAETRQRSANVAIDIARPPSFLRTWKTRGAAELARVAE